MQVIIVISKFSRSQTGCVFTSLTEKINSEVLVERSLWEIFITDSATYPGLR